VMSEQMKMQFNKKMLTDAELTDWIVRLNIGRKKHKFYSKILINCADKVISSFTVLILDDVITGSDDIELIK